MDDGQQGVIGQGGNGDGAGLEVTIRAGGVTVATVRIPLAAVGIGRPCSAEGPPTAELLADGLTPLDQAERIGELVTAGWSVEAIASATAKKASFVARRLLLLRADPVLRWLMRRGLLSDRRAHVLGRLPESEQAIVARWAAGLGPKDDLLFGPGAEPRSLRQLRQAVNAVLAGDVTAAGLWDWTAGAGGDEGAQPPANLFGPMFRRVSRHARADSPGLGSVEAVG